MFKTFFKNLAMTLESRRIKKEDSVGAGPPNMFVSLFLMAQYAGQPKRDEQSDYKSCLLLCLLLITVGACSSGLYSLDLALISCHLYNMFLAVLLGTSVLPKAVGSAHTVVVLLLQMNCI